jgi:hypothetical protein
MDEFAARRNNLEQLIGTETEVDEEVHLDA